jgi:PAS domain S-box-containing protein
MYDVSGFMESKGITLPKGKNLSQLSGTAAIIIAALLAFLIIMPTPAAGGLSGLLSLFQAIILSGVASLFVTWLVVNPMISSARDAELASQQALTKSQDRAADLTSVLNRLNLQKQVLDQHAIVSESDADGVFTYVNDAFCAATGYSREELIGKPHSMINGDNHSDDFWMEMYNTVLTGSVWQDEVCNKRKDGTHFWLIQTIAAVKNDRGEITGYIDFGADITVQKDLQEEMIRKSKLAQLGQLTSTVAHEIRNPLGAVKTGTYLIQKKIEKNAPNLDLSTQFRRINNGIQRCDKIITQLLDFSRSRVVNAQNVELDSWVKEIVDEESGNISKKVDIQCDLGLGGQMASIDSDQLRRVLVNLINNAAEAMVGKGNDVIENPTEAPKIEISTRLVDSNIEISVSDNGPGILPEHLDKIREPLFTTKSFGVGLGIPAVDKVLENHGGGLRIETEVGNGTKMISWFPADAAREKVQL